MVTYIGATILLEIADTEWSLSPVDLIDHRDFLEGALHSAWANGRSCSALRRGSLTLWEVLRGSSTRELLWSMN